MIRMSFFSDRPPRKFLTMKDPRVTIDTREFIPWRGERKFFDPHPHDTGRMDPKNKKINCGDDPFGTYVARGTYGPQK